MYFYFFLIVIRNIIEDCRFINNSGYFVGLLLRVCSIIGILVCCGLVFVDNILRY